MALIGDIIGFILSWFFFAVAIHLTAKIFSSNKPFSNALIMALIIAMIHFGLNLIGLGLLAFFLWFVLLIVGFLKTYRLSTGKGILAAIVCIIVMIILVVFVVTAIVVAIGIPLLAMGIAI